MITETKLFNLTSISSAVFGQFPVKKLRNKEHVISFTSRWGIWAILLSLFHVFAFQNLFALIKIAAPVFINSAKLDLFDQKMLLAHFASNGLGFYGTYIAYFLTLSKFCKVQRKFQIYDEKFNTNIGALKFSKLVFIFLYSVLWWTEALMAILIIITLTSLLNSNEIYLQLYVQMSWIFYTIYSTSWVLGAWIASLHLILVPFAAAFSIQKILFLAGMLSERIEQIIVKINFLKLRKQFDKLNKSCKVPCYEMGSIIEQCKEVSELFNMLNHASGLILIIFIGSITFSISLLVFTSYYYAHYWNSDLLTINAALLGYLVIFVTKTWSLTSTGELLYRKGEELQKAITYLPAGFSHDANMELQFKLFGSKLNFQLTGHGYFKLNNSTFSSILGAVITYNIVLLQFQNSG